MYDEKGSFGCFGFVLGAYVIVAGSVVGKAMYDGAHHAGTPKGRPEKVSHEKRGHGLHPVAVIEQVMRDGTTLYLGLINDRQATFTAKDNAQ